MDPATAWALAIKAVADMITEIVRGQPADVRAKAWERWERHMAIMERLFKIDEPKEPKANNKH